MGATAVPLAATTLIDCLEWHAGRTPERLHVRRYGRILDNAGVSLLVTVPEAASLGRICAPT